MPDANFNEVLSVSVDLSKFQDGLKQLEAAYDSFIQRLNTKGVSASQVIDTASIGSLNQSLNILVSTAQNLGNALATSFQNSSAEIRATMDTVSEALNTKLKGSAKSASISAEEDLNRVATSAERVAKAIKEINAGASGQKTFSGLDFPEQKQVAAHINAQLGAAGPGYLENMSASNRKFFTEYERGLAGMDEKVRASAAKRADAEAAASARATQAIAASAASQATVAKESAALRSMEEGNASTQAILLQRKVVEATQNAYALRVKAAQEWAAVAKSVESGAANSELRIIQTQAQMAETAAKRAENSVGSATRAMASFNARGSDFTRFFTSIVKDLPEFAANVLRFQLLYSAAIMVTNSALRILKSIKDEFMSGWNYLTKLQETAEAMQGPILASVQFSKNMKENFQLTWEAATGVAKKLQEIAINDNLKPENLQRAFNAFQEGGGATLTRGTMNESVRAVEMFSLALKAAGKDVQVTRTLISEIPKLINGSIQETSLLLKVIGLTKEEWQKVVEQAKIHHDLIPQLEEKLKPYLDVVSTASSRMHEMVLNVDLLRQRWDALVAGPMFDEYLLTLQRIVKYAKDNEASFSRVAATIGGAVKSLWDFLGVLLKIVLQTPILKEAWNGIAMIILAVVEAASVVLSVLSSAGNMVLDLAKLLSNPDLLKNPKALFADFWSKVQEQGNRAADQVAISITRIKDMIEGTNSFGTSGSGLLDFATKPIKSPEPNTQDAASQLKSLREQYRESVDEVRTNEEAIRNVYKEAVAAKRMSVEEASNLTIASFSREEEGIRHLGKKYIELGEQIRGLKKGAEDAFAAGIAANVNQEVRRAENGITQQTVAVNAEYARIEKESYTSRQALLLAHKRAILAIMASEVSEGRKLRSDYLQSAIDEEQAAFVTFRANAIKRAQETHNDEELYKIQQDIAKQRQESNDRVVALSQQKVQSLMEEKYAMQDLQNQTQALNVAQEEEALNYARSVGDSQPRLHQLTLQLIADKIKLIEAEIASAVAHLNEATALGLTDEAYQKQANSIKELILQKQKLTDQQSSEQQGGSVLGGASKNLFGKEGNPFQNSAGEFDLTSTFASLKHAFESIINVIQSITDQLDNGNVVGAIGAGMSAIGAMIPGPIGMGMQLVGSVMSFIGNMFTKKAKEIANTIKSEIDKIMASYNAGDTTLVATIRALEAERISAIERLSGQKGGSKELQGILKSLDSSLASLKKQQKDIITNFTDMYNAAALHSDTLAGVYNTWVSINKQIKDYIGAGGSAATAAKYLQLELLKMRETAQASLSEGEKTAIADALSLNSLLEQRNKLEQDFNKQLFDIQTAGSLERRGSQAIQQGQQLADAKKSYKEQADALDNQIALTQKKVDAEQKVFDLAKSKAELQAISDQLELDALDKQISMWKDLIKIISGIVIDPKTGGISITDWLAKMFAGQGGSSLAGIMKQSYDASMAYLKAAYDAWTKQFFGMFGQIADFETWLKKIAPGLGYTVPAPPTTNIAQINLNFSIAGANGTQIGQDIAAELQRQLRYGWK